MSGGPEHAQRGPRPAYIAARGWEKKTAGSLLPALSILLWWHDHASTWLANGGDVGGHGVFSAAEHASLTLPVVHDERSWDSDAPASVDPTELRAHLRSVQRAAYRVAAIGLVNTLLAGGDAPIPALLTVPEAPPWTRRMVRLLNAARAAARSGNLSPTPGVESAERAEVATLVSPPRPPVRVAQRVPLVPPGFIDGVGIVSADQVTAALMAAIRAGRPGWRATTEGFPTFSYDPGGRTAPIEVFLQPPEGTPPSAGLAELMWEMVEALDDLDTDILNILQAHILRHRDTDGFAWITSKAILADRDILPISKRIGSERRSAGHRTDDMQQIAASMARLQYMAVRVATISHGRGHVATFSSRVLVEDLQGSDDGTPMAWHVTLPFLTRLILQRSAAPEAMMLQDVLRYDRKHNRREKRMGDYFLRQFRLALSRPAPSLPPELERQIQQLNGDAQPLVVVRVLKDLFSELALSLDVRNPERTRTGFEAAMGELMSKDIVGSWGYCASLRLPPRRWLETWLSNAVWATSPARVTQYYAQTLPAGARAPSVLPPTRLSRQLR